MNRTEWNEFVAANDREALTLTLADRNLISDADEHINWLESRKRHSEAQVATARAALQEVSDILTKRHQDGWEQRLLDKVNEALKETKV